MFSSALRRSTAGVLANQKRGLRTEINDALIQWAEAPIYRAEEAKKNPIVKEKFTGLLILATAGYVSYAYSRPLKDSTLFDFRGEINLPIITPVLNYIMDKTCETTRQTAVGIDPFENFTEEEKMDRLRQLDAVGYFDRFWQDQNDDVDKMRIMTNTTVHALFRRAALARRFPERAFTFQEIADHVQLLENTKQPTANVAIGENTYRIETPLDRHAVAFATIAQASLLEDNKFIADKDAYAKAMGL